MPNRTHSNLNLPPPSPTCSLNYEKCTTAELRKFVEERTHTKLTEGQLQKVRDHGSYPLIDHLRQMDRENRFPRFMELAPELRLGVYEALLVAAENANKHKHEWVPTLHSAVLRTSKQVYSEAMPVLYKQNKFRAAIEYSEQPSWSRPSRSMPFYTFSVYRPGGQASFHHMVNAGLTSVFRHRTETSFTSILRPLFESPVTAHMLRILTHLTIDLGLVTPRGKKQESDEYSVKACDAIKSLCLALAGASKLEELSIIVKPGDQDSSDVDPADIMWPLLLLRSDITVKFEGIIADPEKMSTRKRPESIDPAFCQRIALVRQLGNIEFGLGGAPLGLP